MVTFAIGLHKEDRHNQIIFYDFAKNRYIWISDINNVPPISDWIKGNGYTFADWDIRDDKRINIDTIATFPTYEEYLRSDKTYLHNIKESYPEFFV